jgi:hypothetical protein
MVFLALSASVISLPRRTLIKKLVNLLALGGIVARRITGVAFTSASFWVTVAISLWSVGKLFDKENDAS